MVDTAQASNLSQMLCLGSSGPEVTNFQTLLNGQKIAPPIRPDGRFGKRTHGLVIAFQRKKGLVPDGVVGPKTALALGLRFTGGAPQPYTVSYDRPPLSGLTPPLLVIGDVMRTGFDRYKAMLLAEVPRTGLSEKGIKAVTRDIETLLYPHLMETLDSFLQITRTGLHDAKTEAILLDLDVMFFSRGLLHFIGLLLELARRMKEVGAKVGDFVAVIDKGHELDRVAQIASRIVSGERSVTMTIAEIQMSFRAILGVY